MSKHDKTLAAIFARPVRANVKWADIESLFLNHGADIEEGGGSSISVALNGVRSHFHRPHPSPNTDKGALKSVQKFLIRAGVKP